MPMTSSMRAYGGSRYYFYFQTTPAIRSHPQQFIIGTDHFKKLSQELRIASPADKPLRVIAGAFYQRQSNLIHQDYQVDDLAPRAVGERLARARLWLTQQKRVDRDYALFGEASFDVTPQITLTGGRPVLQYRQQPDRLLRLRPESRDVTGRAMTAVQRRQRAEARAPASPPASRRAGDSLRDSQQFGTDTTLLAAGRRGKPVHQPRRVRERQGRAEARARTTASPIA